MSDLDLTIRRSKRLERRLRDGLNATGKGLHELTSSVQKRLPRETVKKLRFVASVRNAMVHDLDVTKLDDKRGFVQACDAIEREIDTIAGPGRRDSWRLTLIAVAVIALFIIVGIAVAIFMMNERGIRLEWSFG